MKISDNTFFLHICPECFGTAVEEMNIFELSGDSETELLCRMDFCNTVTASIAKTAPCEYLISAECIYCGGTHRRHFTTAELWNTDYGELQCPITRRGIFFFGTDKEKLNRHGADTIVSLRQLMGNRDQQSDPVLLEMTAHIERIMAAGGLECANGCDKAQLTMSLKNDLLIIRCRQCGNSAVFEINKDNLVRLMNSEKIIIT
ncbi:MAG: hypothetical protein ACI4TH_09730 [Candidatus Ornithomonoglobus sp.]